MMDGDYISRQAAIDALNDLSENYTEKGREWHPHINFVIETIDALPPADVKPVVRGKWIAEPNCMYRCSECKSHFPSLKGYMEDKYCRECGADMREGDANDD